jgi:hypothetical protein
MKPVKVTKQDQFGYERTFVIRRDETCGKMFLAEIDPDFVDISYIVNLCRLDMLDAYRIPRQLDDSGFVVFEVTVAYLLTQSII